MKKVDSVLPLFSSFFLYYYLFQVPTHSWLLRITWIDILNKNRRYKTLSILLRLLQDLKSYCRISGNSSRGQTLDCFFPLETPSRPLTFKTVLEFLCKSSLPRPDVHTYFMRSRDHTSEIMQEDDLGGTLCFQRMPPLPLLYCQRLFIWQWYLITAQRDVPLPGHCRHGKICESDAGTKPRNMHSSYVRHFRWHLIAIPASLLFSTISFSRLSQYFCIHLHLSVVFTPGNSRLRNV